jgi:8-oxo-dGTP pyrophosphatase MutT (NUDIX family)
VVDSLWRILLRVAYRCQLAYWFLRRPREHSAHAAVWWRGRLLVVRNTYRRGLAMPAGGIHRGETPGEAARRELREEVGIAVAIAELRPAGVFVSRQQFKEDHGHVFELEISSESEPAVAVDGREVAAAEFASADDLAATRCCEVLRSYLEERRAVGRPA